MAATVARPSVRAVRRGRRSPWLAFRESTVVGPVACLLAGPALVAVVIARSELL